jgi:hypothetical protein
MMHTCLCFFLHPPPSSQPTNQPTSLPQNKHTLFCEMFLFQLFQFVSLVERLGGGKTDRQTGGQGRECWRDIGGGGGGEAI